MHASVYREFAYQLEYPENYARDRPLITLRLALALATHQRSRLACFHHASDVEQENYVTAAVDETRHAPIDGPKYPDKRTAPPKHPRTTPTRWKPHTAEYADDKL
ncbi:hypothetical protein COCC4DRAFT_38683 [Bipolaris maydis ATCC 48331]|uniref:Uncharacterized protein n=2 Tax=Cochliobolus heterostrophus TaxID=5016 RepID=M2V0K0_COCH5|nr:uncharacterized protein COCC4DRAFT_38683 [Bipolaris maydis ATCC 48331]EMD93487.1 hypothetical protein COCHEDRAFT_1028665 [Bipolaris maydis C5]ENI07066.1 hypothetical protein COCC4DRAFT_38683 [Bipolaris maydis ATCC 48331]